MTGKSVPTRRVSDALGEELMPIPTDPHFLSWNRTLRARPALYEADSEPAGFLWLDVDNALEASDWGARLLLTVHDELVFEVPQANVKAAAELVQHALLQATA